MGLPTLDLFTPRAAYVARSLLAAGLALVVAYALQLHAPYSAASSALLVIHPTQGAVLGKGLWRVLGTLAGMLAALVLMSAFGQMPWLFLLGFALWLGLCVAAMTLLRHFRAYGATLAGYTVGLAVYGAMQHPELTFDQVMGRGASVLVGVLCLGVVSAAFSRRTVHGRLEAGSRRLAAATAGMLGQEQPSAAARHGLMVDIYALDDLLVLGRSESAELASRAAALRHGMVSLFAALVAVGAMPAHLHAAWRRVGELLAEPPGRAGVEQALEALQAMRQGAADPALEQIDDFRAALQSMLSLYGPTFHVKPGAVAFHRDWPAARQNALRAMLTVLLGSAFWLATGWTHGHMMLAGLAAACALLSTAPNPVAGAVEFIKGTVIAVVMAFVCAFLILPVVAGLPLLLVVLAVFWLPGVYATTVPRHALAGVAYLVAFTTLAAADNPMRYDMAAFLNGSLAWVLATFFTLLGFRILLPRQPAQAVARLRRAIRDDALGALRRRSPAQREWQWRQQHRMAQLGSLLRTQPEVMDGVIAEARAAMHLGREVMRLREAVALRYVRARIGQPLLMARHARRAARASGGVERVVLLEIAAILEGHLEYFSGVE